MGEDNLMKQLASKTRDIKTMSQKAKDVIGQDIRNIDKTDEMVNRNTTKVDNEVSRLDAFNKSSSICGTLTLMFTVFIIFCAMVVFIRLCPNIHAKNRLGL